MASVYVISRIGNIVDIVERKLKTVMLGVGSQKRKVKRLDKVSYKNKTYPTTWRARGQTHSKHLDRDIYFIYPWGELMKKYLG